MDDFYSAGIFEGCLRDMLHAYKYQGKDYLTSLLVDLWIRYWPLPSQKWDVIVPVPMPFWREIKRGYNQASLLAEVLGKRWGIPIGKNILGRGWISSSQTKLNRDLRIKNAHSSFYLKTIDPQIKLTLVLLVDDICTTGATLDACARLLKQVGAKVVMGSTIAQEHLKSIGFKPFLDGQPLDG